MSVKYSLLLSVFMALQMKHYDLWWISAYHKTKKNYAFFLFVAASVCLRPPASDSVMISPFKHQYNTGETITLSCQAGFAVTGQTQYTCGKDLSWIPPILRSIRCEKG